MTTTIIIWGALTMMVLTAAYALTLAAEISKLRRQAAEDAVTVFNLTKDYEAKLAYHNGVIEASNNINGCYEIAIADLQSRLAKFETYKSLPRDEHGRFMKKGADPQIGKP